MKEISQEQSILARSIDTPLPIVGTGDGQLVRSRVNITSWSLSGIQSCDWISGERYFRFMCEEKLDVLCGRTLILNSTSSLRLASDEALGLIE